MRSQCIHAETMSVNLSIMPIMWVSCRIHVTFNDIFKCICVYIYIYISKQLSIFSWNNPCTFDFSSCYNHLAFMCGYILLVTWIYSYMFSCDKTSSYIQLVISIKLSMWTYLCDYPYIAFNMYSCTDCIHRRFFYVIFNSRIIRFC